MRRLASGEGITYKHWPPGTVFYEGRCVDLSYDFNRMALEARNYENYYGKDKGHGWLLRHPIGKLKLYQEYCNEG